jgi:peptidoglycan hydrolase CwlO-like protein
MENKDMDIVWALEQASRYARKYTEAKEESQRLEDQLKALRESLDQAKKEIGYLSKLSQTQQQYIEKLEECITPRDENINKETTILTIHRRPVKEDAC